MTPVALDSSALVSWVLQQRGGQAVDKVLTNPNVEPLLLGPVLTEVITVSRRLGNRTPPDAVWAALQLHGAKVVQPDDDDLMRAAELLRLSEENPGPPRGKEGRRSSLSLADAMILAIAERRNLPVMTRDRHWEWFVDKGFVTVRVKTF